MQIRTNTDRMLMDSFKELTLHLPVEKITIKEITDKAGVIRPTFYNHFQDKYEMIEKIIVTEILDPVKMLLANDMITEAQALIFANLQKDKAFYVRLSRMQGPVTFEDIAKKCIRDLFKEYVHNKKPNSEEMPRWFSLEHIAQYYAQSFSFIIIWWIQSGMTVPPKEMSGVCEYMMTHSMSDAVTELF